MHQYILTRMSILDTNHKGFELTRKHSKQNIKNALFTPKRLQAKFALFDKATYPSILAQTYKDYTCLIYASTQLPEQYKKKLNGYAKDNILIIYVKNFKEMDEDIRTRLHRKTDYSTIRLDDDDWLNPMFLEMLTKYKDKKGAIISAPHGRWFRLRNGAMNLRKKIYYKKIGAGLAGIGFNIFNAGKHTDVNRSHKVIYDDLPDAFYRSCSDQSNTRKKC